MTLPLSLASIVQFGSCQEAILVVQTTARPEGKAKAAAEEFIFKDYDAHEASLI